MKLNAFGFVVFDSSVYDDSVLTREQMVLHMDLWEII